MVTGEGYLVSPGESESVIPLDVDKIICKGHHVADPQVFITSASTGDAQAASSSADDAASFPTSVGLLLCYQRLRCTKSMSAQCTVLQFEMQHHRIIEPLLFLLLVCLYAQWGTQHLFWL